MWPKYEMLPPETLAADHSYQRPLDERQVGKMARGFDDGLFGAADVNRRPDGSEYIVDGQHRVAAAVALKVPAVPCLVSVGLDRADEARRFVLLQTQRRALRPYELWAAGVAMGNEADIELGRVVEASPFRLARSGNHRGTIAAVGTLQRQFQRFGGEAVALGLDLLTAWEGEPKQNDGKIVWAVIEVVGRAAERRRPLDVDRLRRKMEEVAPLTVIRRASTLAVDDGSTTGSQGDRAAQVLRGLYDHGLLRHRRLTVQIAEAERAEAA